MSRRDKKRREQERRKAQQQRHKAQRQRQRKPLSSQSQAKDNDSRVAYMVETYTRIRDGAEKFKDDNNGRMPAIILLLAEKQQIVMADKLEPFVAGVKTIPGINIAALQSDMVKREYADDDCLLLVEAGHGVFRTSFANATLRYELRDSGLRMLPIGM